MAICFRTQAIGVGLISCSRMLGQAAQFLTMLAAVRFLSPAEFGIFALSSAVVIAVLYLAEAGWREVIVKAEGTRQENQAFVLALGSGALLAVLAGLGGWTLGQFFGFGIGALIAAGLSPSIFLATVSSVQSAILIKQDRLKALAGVHAFAEIIGAIFAMLAFFLNLGVFALVAGRLAAHGAAAVAFTGLTRRGVAAPNWSGLGDSIRFSRRILLARLLGFAEENAGLFLIGAVLGPAGAGLYRAGARLSGMLAEAIGEPTRILAWGQLAGAKEGALDARPPQRRAASAVKFLMAACVPVYLGAALVSQPLVEVLLGPGWEPAAAVLAALALRQALLAPRLLADPLLAGGPGLVWTPRLAAVTLAFTLIALSIAAPYGVEAASWGQAAAGLAAAPILAWVFHRHIGIRLIELARTLRGVGYACATLAVCVVTVRVLFPALTPVETLALQIGVGGVSYLLALMLFEGRWIAGLISAPAAR
jgi:O-antigen/teichoic acid export membrane protein